MSESAKTVISYLHRAAPERLRPPQGNLKHPYVDPGAGYEDILWEWDAYFCCVGMEAMLDQDARIADHIRGCVDNFLERQGPDGHIPYSHTPKRAVITDEPRSPDSQFNQSKPLHTQFTLMAHRVGRGDIAWLAECQPKLERFIEHWFDTQNTKFGLLTWRSHRGSGADNHPTYFQRPHNTVACPYLNSMMVLELRAMADLCKLIGQDSGPWEARAAELSENIEKYLWDPIDEAYYAIDVATGDPGKVRTPRNWVVPLKFRSWFMAMPLWANVASAERAEKVVKEHLLNPVEMRSPTGIRTLAKNEPAYQIFANYNPSDWLGPVWVVSTYMCWVALKNYGYEEEAHALAVDHIDLLARDIEANGLLHEYYEPETGEGLTHPGFMNWNTLALYMAESLLETSGA